MTTETHEKTLPMDAEVVSGDDANRPIYPEGILPKNDKYDFPSYEGDLTDLTERRNVKLFNVWRTYSNLRKNEQLVQLLEKTEGNDEETKFLKLIIVLTVDRLGKILSDTNIMEEMTKP